MVREYDLQSILEKLQRPRGYQSCRIRPHVSQKNIWYAEMYTTGQTGTKKSWKPLSEANEIRTFSSPGEAKAALIEARGEVFTDNRPFIVQLQSGIPEEDRWNDLISHAEQQVPGVTSEMIEDAAKRLASEPAISAELRYRIDAFGHELVGTGSYLQYGAGIDKLVRLDLRMQVGEKPALIEKAG